MTGSRSKTCLLINRVSESKGCWSNDRLRVGLGRWRICRGCWRDFRWRCVHVLGRRRRRRNQRAAPEPPRVVDASIHRLQSRLQVQRQRRIDERIMNAARKRLLLRMLRWGKRNWQFYRGNKRIFPCRMMRVVKMIADNWGGGFHWMVVRVMMMIVVRAPWVIVVVVVAAVVMRVVSRSVVMMLRAVGLTAGCRRLHKCFRFSSGAVFVVGMLFHVECSGGDKTNFFYKNFAISSDKNLILWNFKLSNMILVAAKFFIRNSQITFFPTSEARLDLLPFVIKRRQTKAESNANKTFLYCYSKSNEALLLPPSRRSPKAKHE